MTDPWWLSPGFIAFDTETTGTNPAEDRIVTAAAVRFENGEPVDARSWLLKIDIPIPQRSIDVHGITNELSQSQGTPQEEALAHIREHLTAPRLPLVAFNSTFDIAMLNANLERMNLAPIIDVPVLCPYVLDKQFNKYVKGKNQRRLMPTIQRYGLELNEEDWHGAEADATITGKLLLAQFDAYENLRAFSPANLAEQVDEWREQQDREFKEWLAKQPPRT